MGEGFTGLCTNVSTSLSVKNYFQEKVKEKSCMVLLNPVFFVFQRWSLNNLPNITEKPGRQ